MKRLLVLLVVLVGLLLRVWRVTSVPPSLGNDEISIAYDAYSVVNTGRDSSGTFLPLSFKSHGTYKAPLYAYTAMPFIRILGNNELSVRLPSVIFGTLTILALYFLVEKITGDQKLALISSFLLAVTPWHVYTSRIALEANLALFFVTLGVYLFFIGFKNRKFLMLSSLSLALSLYAYHTEWVFVPLIMVSLATIYHKEFESKKDIFYWFLLFMFLVIPIGFNWLSIRNATNRASTEFILNDLFLRNRLSGVLNPLSLLFVFVSFWIDKILKYLSFDYIFTNGLPVSASYSAPQFGLLNLVELPIFIFGVFKIAALKNLKIRNLWIAWIAFGALVVSLTLGGLNLVRYLIVVIPLIVIVGYGLIWIKEKTGRSVFYFCLFLVVVNFAFFYKYYTSLFPFHFSENWQYGYKQVAAYIKQNEPKYKKIIIDPRFGVVNNDYYGVPNLYLLYFNKLDPSVFLDTKKVENGNLEFMNKYYIRNVDWTKEVIEHNTLYVVSVHSSPLAKDKDKIKEIYAINILDGTKAFKIYESD